MMHAIRGAWVGQIFAQAKCNESEGKKTRIRRSKEERKTMVESFIKNYQSSNNGNFPSLNLTHKEVGGSFYTVREIVREIIQENRVLGPAAEELDTNQFDEEYPLGTISIELQTPPDMISNGSPFGLSHEKGNNEEHPLGTFSTEPQTPRDRKSNGGHFGPIHEKGEDQVSISEELCHEHENQMFDNEHTVNGSQVDVKTEKSAQITYEETSKSFETIVDRLVASTAKVTPLTADVVVETFPLRPVPKTSDSLSATNGVKNSTETLEINEKMNMEAGNDSAPSDHKHSSKNSGSLDGQNGTILAGLTVDKNSDRMKNEVVEKPADPRLKSLDCFTMEEGTVPDTVVGSNVEVEVSHNDVSTPEINEENEGIDRTKEINAPNGKILADSYSSSSRQESKTPKANVISSEADVPGKTTSQKGSNLTVDRISLESWERVARNSSAKETNNPLAAIFKSFVTALMKFWSE